MTDAIASNALPPKTFAGRHPEAACLRSVLLHLGARDAHTGEPPSEAMLVGLGGLGAGYILWEFHEKTVRALVLAFNRNWQYPERYLGPLCDKLSLAYGFHTTGSAAKAARDLDAALAAGTPPIAWVDLSGLPYRFPARPLGGNAGHVVCVYGRGAGSATLYDRGEQPFSIGSDELAAARARIGSFHNRLLVIRSAPESIDLRGAIGAAIGETVAHLSAKSDSFSLPSFRKWARLLADDRAAKSWRTVFADGQGLFGVLANVFTGTHGLNETGGSLRDLYADFLLEAATILDRPSLRACAETYRELGARWKQLGESALPDPVPELARAKALYRERHELLQRAGPSGLSEIERLTTELNGLSRRANAECPLDPSQRLELFSELHRQVAALYALETEAVAELRAALPGA